MGYMKELDIRIRQGGDDAIAAVSELLPHWIPVEERLPEEECRCLVAIGGEVRSATYYPPGKFQPEITHWMPLPEPPAMKPSVADVISHAEPKGQGHASGQIPGCLVDHDPYRPEPPEVT